MTVWWTTCCCFMLLLIAYLPRTSYGMGADQSELQMYDLVEEVKENFYSLLKVDRNASPAEIRRAYRTLSRVMHPDKNPDNPNATETFRRIVAIYEVLKSDTLRKSYDHVLDNGLPDWRQPLFYYRKLRKMNMLEVVILLTLVISVGHYFVLWGQYLEYKMFVEERVEKDMKRRLKNVQRSKRDQEAESLMAEELNSIPLPTWRMMLPLALARGSYAALRGTPSALRALIEAIRKVRDQRRQQQAAVRQRIEDAQYAEELEQEKKLQKKLRKIAKATTAHALLNSAAEQSESSLGSGYDLTSSSSKLVDDNVAPITEQRSGAWTEDEVLALTRATARFPVGTRDRWQRIADVLARPVNEVTAMVRQVKEQGVSLVPATATLSVPTASIQPKDNEISMRFTSAFEVNEENAHFVWSSEEDNENDEVTAKQRRKRLKEKQREQRHIDKTQQHEAAAVEDLSKGPTGDNDQQIKDEPAARKKPSAKKAAAALAAASALSSSSNWSQEEQQLLENAMRRFPKGTHERWERVAEVLPGRTKEECMERFRVLAESIKKRKEVTSLNVTA